MSWYGGPYETYDKTEPGAYIKIRTTGNTALEVSERGYLAVPMSLPWGVDGEVMTVTADDYKTKAQDIFGLAPDAKELTYIEEMFKHAQILYIYRVNGGERATSDIGTAQCSGNLGNQITVVVEEDPEAGVVPHDMKNADVQYANDANRVTVTVTGLPDGYVPTAELYKEDGEEKVESSNYTLSVTTNQIVVQVQPKLNTGTFKLKIGAKKEEEAYLLSTATLTTTYTPAEVSQLKIEKGTETKNSELQNNEDETLKAITVSFEITDTTVKVNYTGLQDSYDIEGKLLKGAQEQEADGELITRQVGSNTLTYSFVKGCPIGEYTLSATVIHMGKSTEISKHTFTTKLEGQDKDEAITVDSASEETAEDYSEDLPGGFIVRTVFKGTEYEKQNVKNAKQLKDNSYVKFNKDYTLEENAGLIFAGGVDGEPTGKEHDEARAAFESYFFNILAVPTADKEVQDAYINYMKRQRDEYGVKFQLVLPYIEREAPINHEGAIQVGNKIKSDEFDPVTSLVYWVAGAEAACENNASLMNTEYDGVFEVQAELTRKELKDMSQNGVLIFHKEGTKTLVYKDINSLVNPAEYPINTKSDQFKQNQTIRVLDGLVLDTVRLFNTYFLGKEQNDEIARIDFKNRLIKLRKVYETRRAIGPYDEANMNIAPGPKPNEVIGSDAVTILNAMEILYFEIDVINE